MAPTSIIGELSEAKTPLERERLLRSISQHLRSSFLERNDDYGHKPNELFANGLVPCLISMIKKYPNETRALNICAAMMVPFAQIADEWASGRVDEWTRGRVGARGGECASARVGASGGDWASGRVGEWTSGRVREWVSARVDEWGQVGEWASGRVGARGSIVGAIGRVDEWARRRVVELLSG